MKVWIPTLMMVLGVLLATPALAQEAVASGEVPEVAQVPDEGVSQEPLEKGSSEGALVNGAFRLVIGGDVPPGYSFYAEANVGNGGAVICTTDAAMVDAGYPECVGGGATNEVPFVAPEGQTIEYRVLASRGSELSQVVVAQGTAVASEGFAIEASHDFAAAEPVQETTDAVTDQYAEPDAGTTPQPTDVEAISDVAAAANVEPGTVAYGATGGTGLLPATGGFPVLPLAGAGLVAAALLARRLLR